MTPDDPAPPAGASLPPWMSPPEKKAESPPAAPQVPPPAGPPWAPRPTPVEPPPALEPSARQLGSRLPWAPPLVVRETPPAPPGPLELPKTSAPSPAGRPVPAPVPNPAAPPAPTAAPTPAPVPAPMPETAWTIAGAASSAADTPPLPPPFPPRTGASAPPREDRGPSRTVAPATPRPSERPPRTELGWFRDNLEAFAFAILLALLLRHLCIEVFKIPTKSMEPTLFGDDSYRHPKTAGDRIAVDKTAYLFHGPSRWDVVVFRFPLDWTRNFIKRVTGLPGEWLRIERGDIWIANAPAAGATPQYHPARKPASVREQLYVPVYPPLGDYAARQPSSFWRDDTPGASGFAPATTFDELAFLGGHERSTGADVPPAVLRYGYDLYSSSEAGGDPTSQSGYGTPDVRVRGSIVTEGLTEWTLEWRPGDKRVHTLTLAPMSAGGSFVRTLSGARGLPPLREKGTTTFELESVDGDLRVTIDGEERAVIADELPLSDAMSIESARAGSEPQKLSMTCRGAPLRIRDLRIDHDLYYTNHVADSTNSPESGDAWKIPGDSYFMCGDNTTQSNDSRRWNAQGVRLKGGEEIWYDPSPSQDKDEEPHYPVYRTIGGVRYEERRDVEGVVRRWSPADLEPDSGTLGRRMPFVTRERIVGRAWFAMYADVDVWPLKVPRVSTSGRIRFIH